MLKKQKTNNFVLTYCNNLLLNYGAHLSINIYYLNYRPTYQIANKISKNRVGGKRGLHKILKANLLLSHITNLCFLINQMLKKGANLLIIHGSATPLMGNTYACVPSKDKMVNHTNQNADFELSKNNTLAQLFSQTGALTNWTFLCKSAWNCYKITKFAQNVNKFIYLENWVWDLNHNTRLLFCSKHGLSLNYNKQPDCIILIHPNAAQIKECKKLMIPICVMGYGMQQKITGHFLQSNAQSCYLTYLLLLIINYFSRGGARTESDRCKKAKQA